MPELETRTDTVSRRLAETISPEAISADSLLSAVFQTSLSGILLLKPIFTSGDGEFADLAVLLVNKAARQILKIPEAPEQTLLQLFPHLIETGVFNFYRQIYHSGISGEFNVFYTKDGLNNYFRISATRSGSLLVVNFTDVPDQDRTAVETALRESQERERAAYAEADLQRRKLHNILMQAPAMICIFEGPDHVFSFANPPYQQLVGDRPIIGKPIARAMPELAGQPIFELLDNVYRTGETFFAHEMLVQLDHSNSGQKLGENYYNFIYQATRNLSGEIDGIMVFAYEVTPQVKIRKRVQKLNEDLAAAINALLVTNEDFLNTNAELLKTQQELHQLNAELEHRVKEGTFEAEKARAEANRQRNRLEQFFMQAPAAICVLDGPDLVYELINPAYEQLFPGRQFLGLPLLEALPEIEDNAVYRTFREVYETGVTHKEKGLLISIARQEDGIPEDRYFNFIQQARHNEQGEIDGILVFAFEVTDQVLAQQASEASTRKLQLITDSLPVLIGYLDHEEKYRFANKAYFPWFNKNPEEIIGRFVGDVIGEKAYAAVKKYINLALAGERVDFEATMPYRENFVKHIHTSYVPDIQDSRVVGFYTLVTDVTTQMAAMQAVELSEKETKKLAQELAYTNEELKKTNQSLTRINIDLDNFIYTASHDLKAPILNIEGLMTALLDQLPPESLLPAPVQQIVTLIADSVQRFKRTIEHLTDITKLQKENSFEAEPVQLAEKIEEVTLDLAPLIRETGAQLEIDPSANRVIKFSQKNMRSIIYNLLSNAIKYASPDRKPVVKISCEETVGYHILSVKDNGLGIEPELEHKLFTMFTRLHDHVEGTGIGLYMVKKIIDNAGGKIGVKSQSGTGSEFRVWFPRLSEPDVPAKINPPSTNLHDKN